MVAERLQNSPIEAASTREESEPQRMRWTTSQFHQMGELDWFEGRHAELIEGEIFQMTAMGSRHVVAVHKAMRALERAFGSGFHTRAQAPLLLGAGTDPEPDLAVIAGALEDYVDAHPTASAVRLIVEVSDATLERDRSFKASLYAAAGVTDYWVVDVAGRRLEVRRTPHPLADQPFLAGYQDARIFAESESVTPLAAENSPVKVADLLP